MWHVVYASAFFMLLYRVAGALFLLKMYMNVGGRTPWLRMGLQLLDLELYPILYLNHVLGFRGSSSPQRVLGILEAVFEAGPQVQIYSLSLSVCLCPRCLSPYPLTAMSPDRDSTDVLNVHRVGLGCGVGIGGAVIPDVDAEDCGR